MSTDYAGHAQRQQKEAQTAAKAWLATLSAKERRDFTGEKLKPQLGRPIDPEDENSTEEKSLEVWSDDVLEIAVEADPVDAIEPLTFEDDAEREGGLKAIRWMLEAIGVGGILMKHAAMRQILHLENRSAKKVAAEFGFTRAAISKYVTYFSDHLSLPGGKSKEARKSYSATQKRVWKRRHQRGEGQGKRPRSAGPLPPLPPLPKDDAEREEAA